MATGMRKKIIATMTMKPAMPTACGLIAASSARELAAALSNSMNAAAGSASAMPAIISAQ